MLSAAETLRYAPNAAAQAIARGRSTELSLIVHDITDPYFSSIAAGVTKAARAAGASVILGVTDHDPQEAIALIDSARSHRSQALVLVGGLTDDKTELARLQSAIDEFVEATGSAVALVGQPRLAVRSVAPANESGAADLARSLVALGHSSFAILTGPERHVTGQERTAGFRRGLGTAAAVSQLVPSSFDRDGGYGAMREVIAAGTLPDVVFAVNDVMAVGALVAARESGLVVPDDVGIAGFDDIPTLRDIVPALTTVRVPLERLGEIAVGLVLADDDHGPEELPVTVVLRDSTRR